MFARAVIVGFMKDQDLLKAIKRLFKTFHGVENF